MDTNLDYVINQIGKNNKDINEGVWADITLYVSDVLKQKDTKDILVAASKVTIYIISILKSNIELDNISETYNDIIKEDEIKGIKSYSSIFLFAYAKTLIDSESPIGALLNMLFIYFNVIKVICQEEGLNMLDIYNTQIYPNKVH